MSNGSIWDRLTKFAESHDGSYTYGLEWMREAAERGMNADAKIYVLEDEVHSLRMDCDSERDLKKHYQQRAAELEAENQRLKDEISANPSWHEHFIEQCDAYDKQQAENQRLRELLWEAPDSETMFVDANDSVSRYERWYDRVQEALGDD